MFCFCNFVIWEVLNCFKWLQIQPKQFILNKILDLQKWNGAGTVACYDVVTEQRITIVVNAVTERYMSWFKELLSY